jgi:hypothetical protein
VVTVVFDEVLLLAKCGRKPTDLGILISGFPLRFSKRDLGRRQRRR